MKKIILIISFAFSLKGQNLPIVITSVMEEEQVKEEAIVYGTGYDSKVDENVMWALHRYWSNKTPISSTEKSNNPYEANKNISFITISDFKNIGPQGKFLNTQFRVTNKLEKAGNKNVISTIFDLSFDNFIKIKEPEIIIGSDKNLNLIADKALVYTMLYCSLIKNYTFKVDGGAFKRTDEYLKVIKSLETKNNGTTVLIPTEILSNGIGKEAFLKLKYKYEFDSSENIAKRIKENKNVKHYSQLFLIKEDIWVDYLYIVDLESGDLINWSSLGANTFGKTYKYMDDQRVMNLVNQLY